MSVHRKLNSHIYAAAGTIITCLLIFAFFQTDLSGSQSQQISDSEIDDLELMMEDMLAEDIKDIPRPDQSANSDSPVEKTDNLQNNTKPENKGLLNLNESKIIPLEEEKRAELTHEDTVVKKIEVVKLLKVDSIKTIANDTSITNQIKDITQNINRKTYASGQREKEREKYKFYQKNYRNIINFKKVYPYALKTKEIMMDLDVRLSQMKNESEKKEAIKETEKILFQQYETAVRSMSVTQGKLLLKLIARETDKTGYEIIKNYRGAFSATFWYGVGKIFGTDLKTEFHKNQDSIIETIVEKYKKEELY